MHVTCAGPTLLNLCFTAKSLSCKGRSCSWVCNTFSVILFLCFCTCSYLVTLLISIFWIAFCQVSLIQAFTVFRWLLEAKGWIVSSFHELKGEGEVSMLHLSQVRFGLIPSQRPQFCREWDSEKQTFLVCCLTAPCKQHSSLGGWSAPPTPCAGWTVIPVTD